MSALPQQFVTFRIGAHWLGLSVLRVQEVLTPQRIARVPLAPPEVEGFLNLRGQIVAAVCLRTRLGLPRRDPGAPHMHVVVQEDGELFALLVDEVGDVLELDEAAIAPPPPTLDASWARASTGLVRREHDLLTILSASELLRAEPAAA